MALVHLGGSYGAEGGVNALRAGLRERAAETLLRLMICLAVLLAGLLFAQPAESAISSCSVSSPGVVFSSYDTVSRTAVDGVGTITLTCTGSGTENLSLNFSGGNTGSCTTREMRNGTNPLTYQLFRDAARTASWCDSGSRMDITIDFSSGATQTNTYTIYARVSSGQNPPWGSYSDSLTLAVKKGGGTVTTSTVSISGSVSPICSVSAGSLGFGTVNPATGGTATGTVSVNCSSGAGYQVSLSAGQNVSGTTRRMAGPAGSRLNYELFSDSARSVKWGDGTALGQRVSGTGSGSGQSLIVYGRVVSGQNVAAGSYVDTVLVTVEY